MTDSNHGPSRRMSRPHLVAAAAGLVVAEEWKPDIGPEWKKAHDLCQTREGDTRVKTIVHALVQWIEGINPRGPIGTVGWRCACRRYCKRRARIVAELHTKSLNRQVYADHDERICYLSKLAGKTDLLPVAIGHRGRNRAAFRPRAEGGLHRSGPPGKCSALRRSWARNGPMRFAISSILVLENRVPPLQANWESRPCSSQCGAR